MLFLKTPDGMIRDYVFVKDIVKANVIALQKGNLDYFNIGTGLETTTGKLYREISAINGKSRNTNTRRSQTGRYKKKLFEHRKSRKYSGLEACNISAGRN